MANPTQTDQGKLTPMMTQYFELKDRSKGAVLFFRMGDFYEIFGEDAEMVAPLLELVLTSRERGDNKRIPFCGVPHHSARNYWIKLLKLGYKVALADQVENPSEAKGLVKRDIVRIMTPGSIDDPDGLKEDTPNYLMGAYEDPGKGTWAVAAIDVSTGEIRLGNVKKLDDLDSQIRRFRPKELFVRRFFMDEAKRLTRIYSYEARFLLEPLPEAPLRDTAQQQQMLLKVFGKSNLKSQPSGEVIGGEALLTSIIVHLQNLQTNLNQFMTVRPLNDRGYMRLSDTVKRDLEIFETARRRQVEGSLYHTINHCLSPMGARLLRYSLSHPLLERKQIRSRHLAVRAIIKAGESKLKQIRGTLKRLPDIERLSTRILCGSATPTDLKKVQQCLAHANWLLTEIIGCQGERLTGEQFKEIANGLKFAARPLKLLNEALREEPFALGSGKGVFAKGYDKTLDRLTQRSLNGEGEIEAYQDRLRRETGITSLKVKNHKTFGLLLEVTKSNIKKVPASFIRRQTMVNCERFVTVELQELGEALENATSEASEREQQLYEDLLATLRKFRIDLRSVAIMLARFDLLQCLAWQAMRAQYCEPKINDTGSLELKNSRHPVIERHLGNGRFVPNHVTLNGSVRHMLITGPNMAGKSTVMRQTALAAILNQIGGFVPARSAKMPIFDQIFTRVGASDDLAHGQSTFMVEMSEAATILREATSSSLVILDEVGRGTSTQDGLAIASAILEHLAEHLRCFSMFATHYHELVPLAKKYPSVQVMQTEVQETERGIRFSHRLIEGASGNSFGLEVARLAGIPYQVVDRAQTFLDQHLSTAPITPPQERLQGATKAPLEQWGLEARGGALHRRLEELCGRLERVDINRMTPLQALNFLNDLLHQLRPKRQSALFEDSHP